MYEGQRDRATLFDVSFTAAERTAAHSLRADHFEDSMDDCAVTTRCTTAKIVGGRRFKLVILALLLLSASWFFLWNLGQSSISLRSDEVIYARITQNIIHRGDLFPLTHGNVPTYEKPPLKLWLGAVAPYLIGESNLSFRILDGALGIVTVMLTVALGAVVTQSFWIGCVAGALLLGMPELVISHHGFRRAVLDGLLTILTLATALFTWRTATRSSSSEHPLNYVAISLLCSLAVLTKSVAGFVPAACAMGAILACRPTTHTLKSKAWWSIIMVPISTFALYGILLGYIGGSKALSIFLGVEIFTRVTHGFTGHNTGAPGFYWWYLFVRGASAPRWLLLAGVIGSALGAAKNTSLRFLLVWGIFPVVLYSCAASRVPWYINPFLPFLALIAVAGTIYLLQRLLLLASPGRSPRTLVVTTTAALIATGIVASSVTSWYRAISRHARHVLHDTERIELDLLLSRLRRDHSHFAIVDNSISGRTQPKQGKFNVEGIYRETLHPHLRIIKALSEFEAQPHEVALVKDSALGQLPPGWVELGRAPPFGARTWELVAVEYR